MPSDHLIWDSIPTLAPGGLAPGAARRRRTDAAARRLQAERAAVAAITAWQGDGACRTHHDDIEATLVVDQPVRRFARPCDGGRLRPG